MMGRRILFLALLSVFSSADCQLEGFRGLAKVEKEIVTSVKQVIDVAKQSDVGIVGPQKNLLDNVQLSGPITKGSAMAALFKPTKSGVNRELPVGLTLELLQIPQEYNNLVEDVDGREGFVRVRVDKDAFKLLGSLQLEVDSKEYLQHLPLIIKDGYLKPYRLKELVLNTLEEKAGSTSDVDGVAELFWAVVLDTSLDSLKISKPPQQTSKFPTTSYVDVFVDKKLKLKFSWDVATAIKLNWWPSVAQEFVNRKREWPSKETITSLTQSSHISLIPGDEQAIDKDSLELVYSFAHVERSLVGLRTPQQSLVFLIFKSMLNAHNKGALSDDVATHIMLWTCEELPPDHLLWAEGSTEQALSVLFGKLLEALDTNNLPNYFIRKANVLGGMDEQLRLQHLNQVKRIVSDIKKSVPENVDHITKQCKDILKTIRSGQNVIQDLASENYDIFLKRADLIPKALEVFGLNFLNMGGKKKDELKETIGNVKDSLSGIWNEFSDQLKSEDVGSTVQDKIDQVKDNFDLDDLEKKAKEWLKKWEL